MRRGSAASTCMPRCCRAGAAPRRSTAPIMAGDAESGVTVMRMDEGLDTGADGDGRAHRDRRRHDRRRTARRAVAARRRPDGARAWRRWSAARLQLTPQPTDGVTYAAKIDKAETRIDWAQAVEGRCTTTSADCRRFPAPGSSSAAARIKVLRTTQRRRQGRARHRARRQADHRLRRGRGPHLELQRAGKQPMKAEEFLRGTPVAGRHARLS